MKHSNPAIDYSVAIAVLAAGRGVRFGGGKLDADLGGKAVAKWVTDTAEQAGFARRVIVTGADMPKFAAGLTGWERVINPSPDRGIAGSIMTAAKACSMCERLVIVLADMPFIGSDYLRSLADGTHVTFTDYPDGNFGVPAAFPVRSFGKLAQLSGKSGAATIDWDEKIERRSPHSAACLRDIDTREDLKSIADRLR